MLSPNPSEYRLQVWNPHGDVRSTSLAQSLGLECVSDRHGDGRYLFYDDGCLVVGRGDGRREKPVTVDFAAQWRQRQPGRDMLLKAIGGRRAGLSILDATAGLGRDSLLLASYGAQVTLCERNPIVAALLQDGLERGQQDAAVAEMVARMKLVDEPCTHVWSRGPGFDLIYLDPMFPESKKSAQVKKAMQVFHELVGNDDDSDALLAGALAQARHRVVVKRPIKAPPLAEVPPQFAVTGKALRFDVYPIKALPPT